MSIASKVIAGCSPIAGGPCDDLVSDVSTTLFWGPTAQFFVVHASGAAKEIFWGPTSKVFTPSLQVEAPATGGTYIAVPCHYNTAFAVKILCTVVAVPAFNDTVCATVHDDYAAVPAAPLQRAA